MQSICIIEIFFAMPQNKSALTRYKIIDYLFGQLGQCYTLEQLLNAVNERLEAEKGPGSGISIRTLREDLSTMKKPFPEGFNAPIINHWGSGLYEYSDKNFSIYNLQLSKQDKHRLQDALSILDQIEGLPHYENLREIMTKLRLFDNEEGSSRKLVFFEESYYTEGSKWLKELHEAILRKKSLRISYSPFSEPTKTMLVFPYFLKEYRNRWYLYGWIKESQSIYNLALDRINSIAASIANFEDHRDKAIFESLKFIVGVTLPPESKPVKIRLRVHHPTLPYLLTKPLHNSQNVIEKHPSMAILEYNLIPNFEFEAEIMRLAQSIEVLEPKSLRDSIIEKLKKGLGHYK